MGSEKINKKIRGVTRNKLTSLFYHEHYEKQTKPLLQNTLALVVKTSSPTGHLVGLKTLVSWSFLLSCLNSIIFSLKIFFKITFSIPLNF